MNIYVVPEIDIERFKETGVFAVRLLNNEAMARDGIYLESDRAIAFADFFKDNIFPTEKFEELVEWGIKADAESASLVRAIIHSRVWEYEQKHAMTMDQVLVQICIRKYQSMGQFEDFTNEVCCWDYVEQMEKECHTTEERKKFNRDHEQDFYKCMRLRDRMRAGLRALWTQNVPTVSIQFTLREAYRAESVWLAIRYALAWHDFPEGGMWNDFFSPLNRSDQPMPKVELKEKDGTE